MENRTMKNIFKVTALACLMAAASNAAAGPSANVQVKGTVVQGVCIPTLGDAGVVDMGEISATAISNGNLVLPPKYIQLSIHCSEDTLLSISTIENRLGTSAGAYSVYVENAGVNNDLRFGNNTNAFGLGYSVGANTYANRVGVYGITFMYTAMSVSAPSDFLYRDDGAAWGKSNSGLAVSGALASQSSVREFTLADVGSLIPKPFSDLNIPLKINATLAAATTVREVDNLDGNVTISLNYL